MYHRYGTYVPNFYACTFIRNIVIGLLVFYIGSTRYKNFTDTGTNRDYNSMKLKKYTSERNIPFFSQLAFEYIAHSCCALRSSLRVLESSSFNSH